MYSIFKFFVISSLGLLMIITAFGQASLAGTINIINSKTLVSSPLVEEIHYRRHPRHAYHHHYRYGYNPVSAAGGAAAGILGTAAGVIGGATNGGYGSPYYYDQPYGYGNDDIWGW